jgi:hypothetical protein
VVPRVTRYIVGFLIIASTASMQLALGCSQHPAQNAIASSTQVAASSTTSQSLASVATVSPQGNTPLPPEQQPTAIPGGRAPELVPIPLVEGLTIDSTRYESPYGDYETIKVVDRTDSTSIHLRVSDDFIERKTRFLAGTTITREQLKSAKSRLADFINGVDIPLGSTVEPSTDMLNEVKNAGTSWFLMRYAA